MVFPALRPAPAGRRRDRAVRPQLVQPRRRRARHGLLHRRGIRGFLPSPCRSSRRMLVRSGIMLIKYWFSITDDEQHLRFLHAHPRSAEAVEAVADGPRVAPPLGGLHQGQGGHARAHPHPGGAVVGRRGGRQEARAPQLHRAPADADPLRGGAAREAGRCRSASTTPTTTARRSRRRCTCRTSTPASCPRRTGGASGPGRGTSADGIGER